MHRSIRVLMTMGTILALTTGLTSTVLGQSETHSTAPAKVEKQGEVQPKAEDAEKKDDAEAAKKADACKADFNTLEDIFAALKPLETTHDSAKPSSEEAPVVLWRELTPSSKGKD